MSDHNLSNSNDTPDHPIVKEKNPATAPGVKTYQIKLKNHVLWALEEYAQENKLKNPQAIIDLLEFRLFQLGKLPKWWYERGKLLR